MSAFARTVAPASGRPESGGFTLVESVVALAILSLLMTTVLAALRAFGNTQESLETVTGRTDELRAVSNFLRESLQATVVDPGDGELSFGASLTEGAREFSYFQGDETGFVWKARVVFGESYGGTFLVRVARDASGRLVLWWQLPPASMDAISWEGQQSRVLVPGLQEFQVAYRGAPGADWQPYWDERYSPDLVRLVIKANDRYWPELVMVVQS